MTWAMAPLLPTSGTAALGLRGAWASTSLVGFGFRVSGLGFRV